LNFELITDPQRLSALGWDTFVRAHPRGTVFQSPEMYELFKGSRRMMPVAIGAVNTETGFLEGVLLAVIIRELPGINGYFSSRAVIYGGPLVETGRQGDGETRRRGDGEMVGMLLEALIRLVKNHSIFIQFRNFTSQNDRQEVFGENGFKYRDRLNLIVDTSSREAVIKNMSPSRWRQIRKGLGQLDSWTAGQLDNRHPERSEGTPGSNAEIIEPENLGQVREFFNLLSDLYRYKVKKPLPAWDFFERFYNLSKEGKVGIIRLVKYRGKIIGGILSPVTPGKTIYEWYVCGLDHEYKEVYPSVLATWAAIDYALKNGIPQFDFMGVGIPEREYGVREFKSRFGGEMVNYGRFARINNKAVYMISEIGFNILTFLKKI
jgi:serine/alanine adding enzyme